MRNLMNMCGNMMSMAEGAREDELHRSMRT
jgi:hypothetical protein